MGQGTRLILFIFFTFLIIFSWSAIVSKIYHIENQGLTKETLSPSLVSSEDLAKKTPATIPPSLPYLLDLPLLRVHFDLTSATIEAVELKNYQNYLFNLNQGLFFGQKESIYEKTSQTPYSLVFTAKDLEKQITKEFIFSNSNYTIDLNIEIQNLSNLNLDLNNFSFILGNLDFKRKSNYLRILPDVTIATQEKPLRFNGRNNVSISRVKFLGLRDQYGCVIIEPKEANYTAFIQKINHSSQVGLKLAAKTLLPQEKISLKFRIYLGPQDLQIINQVNPAYTVVMYLSFFEFIIQIILGILTFFYKLVHNWGIAIIFLSIFIYFLLFPLSLKQFRSMKQMQTLQPMIEELKRKYKDEPQKLNKEILRLYQTYKINPLGGCLPLILQIPIFIALYQGLMRLIALKGASFLWIKDLSRPDNLFTFFFAGNKIEINILPILMALGMFFQQKFSLRLSSSSNPEQQKFILVLLPLLFGLFFYSLPAGLVLYWFMNSLLMLVYQFRLQKTK